MPRPRCRARVYGPPAVAVFKPRGVPLARLELLELALEEFEALKLADLRGLYHAEAAERMGVSRPTFGRILASARRKTAAALALGKGIVIEGGHHERQTRGGRGMRIAVATDAKNEVSRHFGRSAVISVYEVEADTVLGREDRPLPSRGEGHGQGKGEGCGKQGHGHGHGHGHAGRGHAWIKELVGDCDMMICGGIGAGARNQLDAMGLRVLLAEPDERPETAALRAAGMADAPGPDDEPGCPENH